MLEHPVYPAVLAHAHPICDTAGREVGSWAVIIRPVGTISRKPTSVGTLRDCTRGTHMCVMRQSELHGDMQSQAEMT
jgi:hypothetical protein